jgi:hypothetical protein
MSSWLRSKSDVPEPKVLRPEVEALLPASARRVDPAMFAPPDDPTDDADDRELEFLAALAGEVDREATAAPAGSRAAVPLRGANPRFDDMHLFREMKDEGFAPTRFDFKLNEVDMGDLLEELSTVRAALRRKAA